MIAWRTGADTGRSGSQVALFLFLLLALGLGIGVSQALAAPTGQSPEEGEALFQRKCTACHTVGGGDRMGPDLEGVTTRRDADWLARFLAAPDQVIASGDPVATELLARYNNVPMPNLGLTEAEVAALIAYLETQAGAASGQQTAPASTAASPADDPVGGRGLFTGTTSLQNGGSPCMACHSAAGIGALGGGTLGPDLTGVHQRLGDALITWPENVAPMKAIYSGKPLTEQEKAHLLAFFQSGPLGQRPAQVVWQLTGLAVAGVAVVLVAAGIIWRRRLSNVRRPMVTGQGRRST